LETTGIEVSTVLNAAFSKNYSGGIRRQQRSLTDNVYDYDRCKVLLNRYSDILVFYAVTVGTYVV